MDRPLNDMMGFDHVVEVHEDGAVTDAPEGIWGPEVHDEAVSGDGWTLLAGWTGQHAYNGPIMHPSEYIGGGLERHIYENPGFYVAVTATVDPDEDAGDDPEEGDPIVGWAIAYIPTESCDECGNTVPTTASLLTKLHATSCSLHPDNVSEVSA